MERAKIDEYLTLRLTESPLRGFWGGESQQKRKEDFFSKFNFLLNALGFRLVNPFQTEL